MRVVVACTVPLLMLAGLWIWAAANGGAALAATATLTAWMAIVVHQIRMVRSWNSVDRLRSLSDGILMCAACPAAGWAILLFQNDFHGLGFGGVVLGLAAGLLGSATAFAFLEWGPTDSGRTWLRPPHPNLGDTTVAHRLAEAFAGVDTVPETVTVYAKNTEGHVSFGQPNPWTDAQDAALGKVAQDIMELARTHSFPKAWASGHTFVLPRLTAHERLRLLRSAQPNR